MKQKEKKNVLVKTHMQFEHRLVIKKKKSIVKVTEKQCVEKVFQLFHNYLIATFILVVNQN